MAFRRVRYIGQGDTSPALTAFLSHNADTDLDITGATVTFTMRDADENTIIDAASCSIVSATGDVEILYTWQDGDTDTTGIFDGRFTVTYPDGYVESFPNDDWFNIVIT